MTRREAALLSREELVRAGTGGELVQLSNDELADLYGAACRRELAILQLYGLPRRYETGT